MLQHLPNWSRQNHKLSCGMEVGMYEDMLMESDQTRLVAILD